MVRISISPAAFDAITATLPIGSVGFEAEPGDEGERHMWLEAGAYAFGDCLVNSFYGVYENAREGFAERYLAMLAAGGSNSYNELLAPFGLNARDPAFWRIGLGVIARMIDELEAMG